MPKNPSLNIDIKAKATGVTVTDNSTIDRSEMLHGSRSFLRVAVGATRAPRHLKGTTGSVVYPTSCMIQMQQDRQLWSLIGGGLALFAIRYCCEGCFIVYLGMNIFHIL